MDKSFDKRSLFSLCILMAIIFVSLASCTLDRGDTTVDGKTISNNSDQGEQGQLAEKGYRKMESLNIPGDIYDEYVTVFNGDQRQEHTVLQYSFYIDEIFADQVFTYVHMTMKSHDTWDGFVDDLSNIVLNYGHEEMYNLKINEDYHVIRYKNYDMDKDKIMLCFPVSPIGVENATITLDFIKAYIKYDIYGHEVPIEKERVRTRPLDIKVAPAVIRDTSNEDLVLFAFPHLIVKVNKVIYSVYQTGFDLERYNIIDFRGSTKYSEELPYDVLQFDSKSAIYIEYNGIEKPWRTSLLSGVKTSGNQYRTVCEAPIPFNEDFTIRIYTCREMCESRSFFVKCDDAIVSAELVIEKK